LAPFSKVGTTNSAPSFSPDGNKLYFSSNRNGTRDIWVVERKDTGWGDPQVLPSPINTTTTDEYSYVQAPDGTGYFGTYRTGGLYHTLPQQAGQPLQVARMGSPVTTNGVNEMPAISPDGSYLLYVSIGPKDNGVEHIYVSFVKKDGSWTLPISCTNINSSSILTLDPFVSNDGRYLFFGRFNLTDNTFGIYWVSTNFINKIKHSNFPPYLRSGIANQTDTVGHSFSYTMPDSTFVDDDGNNTLTYSAKLSNGKALPSWLSFIPGTKTFSGTPDTTGTLKITVTATDTANASASATFTLTINGNPVSIDRIDGQGIEIFPNPTSDKFTIKLGNISPKQSTIEILDMAGRSVLKKNISNTVDETIDLTGNPRGIYLLKLTVGSNIYNKKICLE
jgi:Tol biopolymer transport system component